MCTWGPSLQPAAPKSCIVPSVMPFVGCGSEMSEPRPPAKWAKKIQPTFVPFTKTSIFELLPSQLAVLDTHWNVTGPSGLVTCNLMGVPSGAHTLVDQSPPLFAPSTAG